MSTAEPENQSPPDRLDDDLKDTSEVDLLKDRSLSDPAGGFKNDDSNSNTSDDPRHLARNKYTEEIYSLFDGYGKAVHMVDFDKSCHPADYRTEIEAKRVSVIWRHPYLGWRRVCELPIENGDSEEMRRLFGDGPLREYSDNVCIRRTHHLLYFKDHGYRIFGFEQLKCIVWHKLDKILRPGSVNNFYKTAIKNMFADAYRDGSRAIRIRDRFRDVHRGPRRAELVKVDRHSERPCTRGDASWTGT